MIQLMKYLTRVHFANQQKFPQKDFNWNIQSVFLHAISFDNLVFPLHSMKKKQHQDNKKGTESNADIR